MLLQNKLERLSLEYHVVPETDANLYIEKLSWVIWIRNLLALPSNIKLGLITDQGLELLLIFIETK